MILTKLVSLLKTQIRYSVRPNTGVIEPYQSKEINIALQPGDINQRHKFMIQSIVYPKDYTDLNTEELQHIWVILRLKAFLYIF